MGIHWSTNHCTWPFVTFLEFIKSSSWFSWEPLYSDDLVFRAEPVESNRVTEKFMIQKHSLGFKGLNDKD